MLVVFVAFYYQSLLFYSNASRIDLVSDKEVQNHGTETFLTKGELFRMETGKANRQRQAEWSWWAETPRAERARSNRAGNRANLGLNISVAANYKFQSNYVVSY